MRDLLAFLTDCIKAACLAVGILGMSCAIVGFLWLLTNLA